MVNQQAVGSWAFLIGIIIAILAGAAAGVLDPTTAGYVPLVLVILGLIVGFLNIADKEVQAFLIAGMALLIVGIPAGSLLVLDTIITPLGTVLSKILQMIAVFAAPAVLVVSLKAFYNLSKTPTLPK